MQSTDLDQQAAHRYFSVECFNRAWDLIDKDDRSKDDDDEMLQLGMVSLWHWKQRPDCSEQNLSIGYWQVSRIFSLLEQGENALHYGQLCLQASQGDSVPPFYLGYAYEALARAEKVSGNGEKADDYLQQARDLAKKIEDLEEMNLLMADLKTI
jgi:tetratricopeptide (TPR) repeat protein